MFIVTETTTGNSCVAAVLNRRGRMMELKPPGTLQETSLWITPQRPKDGSNSPEAVQITEKEDRSIDFLKICQTSLGKNN